MVDENGTPKEFYHGTTFDFDEFSKERGNIENDFGIGFYFSSSLDDVESNYDDLQGPDIRFRIASRMEEIMANEDWTPELAKTAREQAEKELSGGKKRIINTYLSIKEPFVLGGDDETYFEYNYDEDEGESGTYIDFIESFRNVSRKYDEVDADQAISDMFEGAGYDSGSATSVMAALRKSEGLQYATDENGKLAGNEILRATLEDMGFDAIVDNNVNKKFGSARQFGQAMDGIYGDTQHVIAFEPGQIKETDAKSFCDKTKINKSIADIIFEKAGFNPNQSRDSFGRFGSGEGTPKGFEDSKAKNKDGSLQKNYHVTTADFEEFDPNMGAQGAIWFTSNIENITNTETGAALRPNTQKYLFEVFLNAKNPAGWTEYDKYSFGELIDLGFDSVKLDDDYIIFEPEQIHVINRKEIN